MLFYIRIFVTGGGHDDKYIYFYRSIQGGTALLTKCLVFP